jgi:hypothetical protein
VIERFVRSQDLQPGTVATRVSDASDPPAVRETVAGLIRVATEYREGL